MARATAPIFSAICGRTRITTGDGRSASVPRRHPARSFPCATCKCRRAVSSMITPCLAISARSRSDSTKSLFLRAATRWATRASIADVDPASNHSSGETLNRPRTCPAARSPAAASAFPAMAASASACRAAIAPGVLRSSQSGRSTLSARWPPRRRPDFCRSRDKTGPDPWRAPTGRLRKNPASSGNASASAGTAPPRPGRLQHVVKEQEIAERLAHLLAVHQQHPVMHPDIGEGRAGKAQQDWAISFSWCGKIRSSPPP